MITMMKIMLREWSFLTITITVTTNKKLITQKQSTSMGKEKKNKAKNT